MSLSEEEKNRLNSFQKNTQSIRRVKSLDIVKEKKNLETDLKYFKNNLKDDIVINNKEEIEKNINSLLELVAKKFFISIKEKEEIYDELPETILEEEIENYVNQCYRLLAIHHKLMQN